MTRRGWLSAEPPTFVEDLLSRGRSRQVRRGDLLYRDGEAPGGVYGVIGGGIGVIGARPGRHPVMAHIHRAGAWFGEGPWQTGSGRAATYRATEAATLVFVTGAPLEELARSDPDARERFGGLGRWTVVQHLAVISDLLIPNAERRIAATLLRVTAAADGVPPDDPEGYIITQSELGEMANVSRHHVNRTLTRFRNLGWLNGRYNRIALRDIAALEAMAAG